MPTFFWLPLDRSRINFFVPIISPLKNSSIDARNVLMSPVDLPYILPVKAKNSSGVKKSIRKPSSRNEPTQGFQLSLRATRCPLILTSPVEASIRSSIRRKNVVFPAPLLPTSPKLSPSAIDSFGISSTVILSYFLLRLFTSIIWFNFFCVQR